jgi:putative restriction endonuclease
MRYWGVNQNQTFRQEVDGGYIWSPKRSKNGHRNPFCEFLREIAPGDMVFSFCETRIATLGIVSGYCRESPKPEEFGTAGTNWSQIGWRVGVRWQRLANAIRPKDHICRSRDWQDRARLPDHQGRAHGALDREPRPALARQQQRSAARR